MDWHWLDWAAAEQSGRAVGLMSDLMSRSFQRLGLADLEELRRLATYELCRFVNLVGNPPGKYRDYSERLIGICLAQGAGQHFVDLGETQDFDSEVAVSRETILEKGLRVLPSARVISGINDLDVWFFFGRIDAQPIPNMRHSRKSVTSRIGELGERCIDFMKKGVAPGHVVKGDARATVLAYLRETEHGRNYLSKKSVVGLYPNTVLPSPFGR